MQPNDATFTPAGKGGDITVKLPPAPVGPPLTLLKGSDIQPRPIRWYWPGWLAGGKVHILAGQPGTGKTTIALALAATITQGGRWPDGQPAAPGNVVIWSGEDDPADTLVPRLLAMGADLDKVFFVGDVKDAAGARAFDPSTDVEPLRREMAKIKGISLVLVDPIVSAVAGDSHKNAEVRRALQPLADLAAKTDCALLGITHFSKGTGGRDPVERLNGSLAFGALARIVMVAAKQAQDDAQGPGRLFARAKSNIGPDGGGFGYELIQEELSGHPGVTCSILAWGDAMEGTARELLADTDNAPQDPEEQSSLMEAKEFLRELLADGQRVQTRAIKADANGAGIAWRTIERAKKSLGVRAKKEGIKAAWWWFLPSEQHRQHRPDRQDRQEKETGKFGGLDGGPGQDCQHRQKTPSQNVDGLDGVGGVDGLGPIEEVF